MCRITVSFARLYSVGDWFGGVRSALLLAVVLCWFLFWVLGVAGLALLSPCNTCTLTCPTIPMLGVPVDTSSDITMLQHSAWAVSALTGCTVHMPPSTPV